MKSLITAPKIMLVPCVYHEGLDAHLESVLPSLSCLLQDVLSLYADIIWRQAPAEVTVGGFSLEKLLKMTHNGRCDYGFWLSAEETTGQDGARSLCLSVYGYQTSRKRLVCNLQSAEISLDSFNSAQSVQPLAALLGWLIQTLSLIVFPDVSLQWQQELLVLPPSTLLPNTLNGAVTYAQAMAMTTEGQRLQKQTLLDQLLRHHPQCELIFNALAKLHKTLGQHKESVQYWAKAIQCGKTAATSAPWRQARYATEGGIACALLHEHEHAIAWWKKAVELSPNQTLAYFNLAHALETKDTSESLEQAIAYLLALQQKIPSDSRVYGNLARVYNRLEQWDKALEQYEAQTGIDGESAWLHSDKANCYLQLGSMDKAKYHFEQAIELQPEGEVAEFARLVLMQL